MEYLAIIFGAVFLTNILLNSLIGFPFLDKKTQLKDVVYTGLKVTVVALLSAVIIYPIHTYLLKPENWIFLTPFIAILIVLNIQLLVDYLGRKLNINFLVTTNNKSLVVINALVFTIGITMVSQTNYLGAMVQTLGFGLGYLLVTVLIFTIKPRLELPGVPKAFKGIPLMLIVLGILGMIFLGLGGIF